MAGPPEDALKQHPDAPRIFGSSATRINSAVGAILYF